MGLGGGHPLDPMKMMAGGTAEIIFNPYPEPSYQARSSVRTYHESGRGMTQFLGGIQKTGMKTESYAGASVVSKVAELEARYRLPYSLAQTVLPRHRAGLGTAGSAEAYRTFLDFLSRAGYNWEARVADESTIALQFLHRGSAMGEAGTLHLPIQLGPYIQGRPRALRTTDKLGLQEDVRRSMFIQRGRTYTSELAGERIYVEQTGVEALVEDLMQQFRGGAPDKPTLLKMIGEARRRSSLGHPSQVWAGATKGPLAGPQEMLAQIAGGRWGSIYELEMASQVALLEGAWDQSLNIEGQKVIDKIKEGTPGWPLGPPYEPGQVDWMKVTEPPKQMQRAIQQMREETERQLSYTEAGLKAETVLGGYVTRARPGHKVPFGQFIDPARPMQRGGIVQLTGAAGTRGAHIPVVSTPWLEASKEYVTRLTGGSGRWGAETQVALVMDPMFERAFAGAGGGAVITPTLQKQLLADITQKVKWESGAYKDLINEGRVTDKAEAAGLNLITSLDTKHTVASVRKMKGAQMAIGWSAFMKGKNPAAIREGILRRVIDQALPMRVRGPAALEDLTRQQRGILSDFMTSVSGIFSGEGYRSYWAYTAERPQFLVAPRAEFGPDQFSELMGAVQDYNTRVKSIAKGERRKGLKVIKDVFERRAVELEGQTMAAIMVPASVMARSEARQMVTKAVGAWTRPVTEPLMGPSIMGALPKKLQRAVGPYSWRKGQLWKREQLYHPGGMKIRLRDLVNLRLWHTKEATQLADLYEKYIKRWQSQKGEEVRKTLGPYIFAAETEAGVKMPAALKDAISIEEFGKMMRPGGIPYHQLPPKAGAQYTMSELGRTIFEGGSPFRKTGFAVQLPKGLTLTVGQYKQAGRWVGGMATSQVYVPSLETYTSVVEEAAARLGPEKIGDAHLFRDQMLKAHEKFVFALSAAKEQPEKVEKAAREFYDRFAFMIEGKKGFLSYLTSARFAHSGYFSLVPGAASPLDRTMSRAARKAEKDWFKRAGVGLADPYTVDISESSAKELGVFHWFRGRGRRGTTRYRFGRVVGYPAIGPEKEMVLRFRMVSDKMLGNRQMRMSNLVALMLARDFDMDKAGVQFITNQEAQRKSKAFYKKSVRPLLKDYEAFLMDDPEWQTLKKEQEQLWKELKSGQEGVRLETMHKLTVEKLAEIRARAHGGVAHKYMTKALTPVLTWYVEPLKHYAQMDDLVKGMGFSKQAIRDVGGMLAILQQEGAIQKGTEGPLKALTGIAQVLGTPLESGAVPGTLAFETKAAELQSHLSKFMPDEGLEAFNQWVQQGRKGPAPAFQRAGVWHTTADAARLKEVSRAALALNQYRLSDILTTGKWRPGVLQSMTKTQKIASTVDFKLMQEGQFADLMEGLTEHYHMMSRDPKAPLQRIEQQILDLAGIGQKAGFDTAQIIANLKKKAGPEEDELLKQWAEMQKNKAKMGKGVLERVMDWFTHVDTPAWQKAGLIAGGVVLTAAVAKSLLFPSYMPPEPPPDVFRPPYAARQGFFRGGGQGGGVYSPPPEPYTMGSKPGGIFGYISSQVGGIPADYGVDTTGVSLPDAKFNFGPAKAPMATGLDIGPGISPQDDTAMIMAGADVLPEPPLPPGIPMAMDQREKAVAATTPPTGQRIARMEAPGPPAGSVINVRAAEPMEDRMANMLEVMSTMGFANQIEVHHTGDAFEAWDGERFADADREFGSFA